MNTQSYTYARTARVILAGALGATFVFLTLAAPLRTFAQTTPAVAGTFFSDDFNGSSLNSNWTVISRHGEYAQSETECNVPSAISVASSTLSIKTWAQAATCGDFNADGSVRNTPQSWPYSTGDVQWASKNFTYGSIEVRARVPSKNTSTWPAIWLLGANCQQTNPLTGDVGLGTCPNLGAAGSNPYVEADLVECYGSGWCQFHVANPSFGIGGGCDATWPVDTNWHTFTTVWDSTGFKQYMDGTLETTCPSVINKPMFLILQTQTGGVGGTPNNANLPASFDFDYVKVDAASTTDTIAPSVPTNLTATAVSPSQINLAWTASTDNVGVSGYTIYRNGTQVTTTTSNSYNDTGLSPSTSYTYTVAAYDATGNASSQSVGASATTQPASTTNGAPTFIHQYQTAWNTSTSPKTTSSFTAQAGDVLVAYAMSEDQPAAITISGGSLAWTQRQVVNTSGYGWLSIWTATVPTTLSMSASFTTSGSGYDFGGDVLQFRNAAVGTSAKTTGASGAPTLSVTTTSNNSAIVVANNDWTALDGSARAWRTGAGSFAEQSYQNTSGRYTIYGGYYPSTGTSSTKTVGLSAPSGQKYAIAAVEITGTGSADATPPSTPTNLTATAVSPSQINLAWTASTDNVGVSGYTIYRNGTQVTTTTSNSYNDTGLSPSTAYTYTVAAYDAAGNASSQSVGASATTQPSINNPSVTLSALPALIGSGDSSTLTWNSANITSCTGTNFSTGGTTSGSVVVTPIATTTYSISCTGTNGTASTSATVAYNTISSLPSLDFPNGSFSWATTNTSSCTGSWGGTVGQNGSYSFTNPSSSTTYILSCTGNGTTVQRSITISTSETATVSTKFTTGQTVTTTSTINVRSTPSTSGTILGTQSLGSTGKIIGGPVQANGYWWWQITSASGVSGWSVENWLK